MDISFITNAALSANALKSSVKSEGKTESSTSSSFSDTAAVYEKSSDTVSTTKKDYSAIVAKMKADTETRANQLMNIVKETMSKQGKTLATADDVWSFLASGELGTVSEAAVRQAQEDISENGYWGVDQTSSRIVDFAIALSGGDTSKANTMIEAFKEGFRQATGAWGKTLPSISSDTYDAVMDKFDQWVNGTYES